MTIHWAGLIGADMTPIEISLCCNMARQNYPFEGFIGSKEEASIVQGNPIKVKLVHLYKNWFIWIV